MRPVRRSMAVVAVIVMLAAACSDAPDPGDIAAFCTLLEEGTGLTPSPTAQDLDRLALVAPPEVQETIGALQSRARDFSELLAEDPPDLEALFAARFDPQANSEQTALDQYALNSCGIAADRPPATRWNSFISENHAEAAWNGLITTQFDVDVAVGRIDTATVVFGVAPEPLDLVEDVCQAVSDFLAADGANPGRVRVFIGSVVALEYEDPNGVCRLP